MSEPDRPASPAPPRPAEPQSRAAASPADPAKADVGAHDDREIGSARALFRYVVVEEWADYRAIMAVFAGTFFSEFTPEEVAARLAESGHALEVTTVADRLESLRRWGNLTVSSSVGNPRNLEDYYRRRNRYLITREGQEVQQVVEGVLARADQVRDVSTGRLRALLEALTQLASLDPAHAPAEDLADAIGAVFDPHEAFTSEITQFFAAINQWQSRYDLSPEELRFFAEVLVGYVGERLDEIERVARPIGRALQRLTGRFGVLVERAHAGLARRVDDAGLAKSIAVTHRPGTRLEDWEHLCGWFLRRGARASRIETLTREAVAAVRTLTLNLTRLSRAGTGAASRRADFLRLARIFDGADPWDLPRLACAAFGIFGANHYGVAAADADDPAPTHTSWWSAPRATVPVSIRERGDTNQRGRVSPMPDRSKERELLRRRRDDERRAQERVDHELLDTPALDGRELSQAALARLQEVVGRTLASLGTRGEVVERADRALICRIARTPGQHTRVHAPAGTLTLLDLTITMARNPAWESTQDAKGQARAV